jgi:hypothetical protein
MDEDALNMSVRKFLKEVGVTSQRVIEQAVREAGAAGRLEGKTRLKARVTLTLDSLDVAHTVEGDIACG